MRADDLRRADGERLKSHFYTGFDRSAAEHWLERPASELDRRLDFLGEGAHFAVWRLRDAAVSLVFKRARARQDDPRGGPDLMKWSQAMRHVAGFGGLIPPFELLTAGSRVGVVMPYGEAPLATMGAHWRPLEERLAELAGQLAASGLVINDVPQGRCWQGVPFLYDLSDLAAADVNPATLTPASGRPLRGRPAGR